MPKEAMLSIPVSLRQESDSVTDLDSSDFICSHRSKHFTSRRKGWKKIKINVSLTKADVKAKIFPLLTAAK